MTGDGRLSALEAGFLWMESDVQPLHVGSLLIFEGPAPDHHELCEQIDSRLAPAPWHRRRAQRMPLDLGRPIWVDSEHFAVAEHLHHAVLDPPGDDAQLRAMVLWIMAERLDVGRPMWELWQVDGLTGGAGRLSRRRITRWSTGGPGPIWSSPSSTRCRRRSACRLQWRGPSGFAPPPHMVPWPRRAPGGCSPSRSV